MTRALSEAPSRNDRDARAHRREVGRTLLMLSEAFSRVIIAFDRSKDDPAAKAEVSVACDDALKQLRRSFEALTWLRESVSGERRNEQRISRFDRHSLAG